MLKSIKEHFEKKDKKGVPALIIMLICGVLLLIASQIFANMDNAPEISVSELQGWGESPQNQDHIGMDTTEAITLSSYLTQQLEEILSLVAGAGQVRVMLTMSNSVNIFAQNKQENIAATIEDDGEGGVRNIHTTNASTTYVMVRRADGGEAPLMLQEISPSIEGIIIVAQGGGDVAVRDALTRATQAALGIAPHRIQVLEMKN
ncbi:MAG: hypothetical protein FWE34_01415 [Defluviitaleaceae bacterium]|nr:hypothetical protein [Defluviitaleaceae bacterium]